MARGKARAKNRDRRVLREGYQLMATVTWITDRIGYVDVTPEEVGKDFIYSYIVQGDRGVAVIETGPTSSAEALAEALEAEGLAEGVIHVIVTHIHLDHGGGAGRLAKLVPTARIYVHPRGYRHLLDPSKLWEASRKALGWLAEVYGEPEPVPSEQLIETADGMEIDLGGVTLHVIHTPGHASHHQSVLADIGGERILFTGDSAGFYDPSTGAVAPTTPPPFRYDAYVASLERQISLRPHTLAFTHIGVARHGEELLQKHVEQVRTWYQIVREKLLQGVEDPAKILEAIAEKDEMTRKYLASRRGRHHDLLLQLSVLGFIEYVKAGGTR